MNKKLIATVAAGAVLSVGIIGLSACGGGFPKGSQVNKEEWAAAFAATVDAKNYTVVITSEQSGNISGKIDETEFNFSSVQTASDKIYVDLTGFKYYENMTETTKVTGLSALDDGIKTALGSMLGDFSDDGEQTETNQIFSMKADGGSCRAEKYNDNDWQVSEYDYSRNIAVFMDGEFSTEKGGEEVKLSALYDAFTYSSGIYTATLWTDGEQIELSVSIKDGYIAGYSTQTEFEEKEGLLTIKGTGKNTYVFSDYGKTAPACAEAEKAINDFVANK